MVPSKGYGCRYAVCIQIRLFRTDSCGSSCATTTPEFVVGIRGVQSENEAAYRQTQVHRCVWRLDVNRPRSGSAQ